MKTLKIKYILTFTCFFCCMLSFSQVNNEEKQISFSLFTTGDSTINFLDSLIQSKKKCRYIDSTMHWKIYIEAKDEMSVFLTFGPRGKFLNECPYNSVLMVKDTPVFITGDIKAANFNCEKQKISLKVDIYEVEPEKSEPNKITTTFEDYPSWVLRKVDKGLVIDQAYWIPCVKENEKD